MFVFFFLKKIIIDLINYTLLYKLFRLKTLVSVVSYSYLLSSQLWFMAGNFTKITYCKANIIDAHSYYVNVSPSLNWRFSSAASNVRGLGWVDILK